MQASVHFYRPWQKDDDDRIVNNAYHHVLFSIWLRYNFHVKQCERMGLRRSEENHFFFPSYSYSTRMCNFGGAHKTRPIFAVCSSSLKIFLHTHTHTRRTQRVVHELKTPKAGDSSCFPLLSLPKVSCLAISRSIVQKWESGRYVISVSTCSVFLC